MSSDSRRSSLVIGSRGSRLALWQAEWVRARIQELAPHFQVTVRRIQTSGDKIVDVPLAKIGGKGLFVKEIEEALLRREIDLAVHSMKDVPSVLPEGLAIVCVPEREDPRDAVVSCHRRTLAQLNEGASIGTSSLRRQAQLLHYRQDFRVTMLRGNLDTRLRKAENGAFDAVVVAAAGLRRLGWTDHVTEYLSPTLSLPAIGQGALGIEGRSDDEVVKGLLAPLDHLPTRRAVTAERAFLARLEGGCQVPIAGHAVLKDQTLILEGLIASVDGTRYVRDRVEGQVDEAEQLGAALAERLLEAGGRPILDEVYGSV
ncbi:MAG: hydroxymethylbilane synthase [Nitrospirae bacterium]|nr:MAG: hydroxymethylbilane synthase [Nitrospirota bacterium]